ncbi:MAG: alpha/beta hydrolase [Desulfosarcina sp.]|nr:alpha/beta hydrolase [Desulfosarcina sp.]
MLKNTEQSVSFVADGLQLSGTLHLPGHEPLAVVVGCHGLIADKHSPKQIALARDCTATGMAYFRFDHRGCGDSEGVFEIDTTLENRASDLMAAVHAINHALGKSIPIGLFGSSLGGTVCLAAAHHLSPFAVVTLAAPVQSRSIQLPDDAPESLKKELVENRLTFNVSAAIGSLHHILIVHGSSDETVSVDNAHRIYRLARDPKARLILKNGDHRISRKDHQKRYLKRAVQWFSDCYHDQFDVFKKGFKGSRIRGVKGKDK